MSDPVAYRAHRWAWWIATGLGSGRLRPAPGTWGSLAACIAWLALVYLIHPLPHAAFECVLGIVSLLMVFFSVVSAGLVISEAGSPDPSYIVCDEWAGMWLALWPARQLVVLSIGGGSQTNALMAVSAAFLLFRIFDIWKPWPVRKLESLPGGWGVTMDDAMAGIYAGLLLYCARAFIPL